MFPHRLNFHRPGGSFRLEFKAGRPEEIIEETPYSLVCKGIDELIKSINPQLFASDLDLWLCHVDSPSGTVFIDLLLEIEDVHSEMLKNKLRACGFLELIQFSREYPLEASNKLIISLASSIVIDQITYYPFVGGNEDAMFYSVLGLISEQELLQGKNLYFLAKEL